MSQFKPCGIATGIGSLPFIDPNEALAFVLRYFPLMPHWPQMPQRGREEYFVYQFLQPLVDTGLLKTENDNFVFDAGRSDWPERLAEFYTICLAAEDGDHDALAQFFPPMHAATGFHALIGHLNKEKDLGIQFLKGQIAGPLTVGLNLKDHEGRFSYYHEELHDVIIRTLALNARCQASALSQFGCPAIIFVDEPAISAYGTRDHLTMTKEMIIEDMNTIFRAVHLENALVGVHACEAIDWSLVFATEMQILSLDAYRFGNSLFYYSSQMIRFLERGGAIAWGIVPTLDDPFNETPDTLINRLTEFLSKLAGYGLDPALLVRQSMISPACGTGLLSLDISQRIHELTTAVSERLCKGVKLL